MQELYYSVADPGIHRWQLRTAFPRRRSTACGAAKHCSPKVYIQYTRTARTTWTAQVQTSDTVNSCAERKELRTVFIMHVDSRPYTLQCKLTAEKNKFPSQSVKATANRTKRSSIPWWYFDLVTVPIIQQYSTVKLQRELSTREDRGYQHQQLRKERQVINYGG